MERQLDRDRRRVPEAQDREPGHPRAAAASRRRRCSATGTWKGCASHRAKRLEADLVVIAAGIRPNAELGRKAGLEVRPRHRRQRLHGDVRSGHLRGRRMHGASRADVRAGRAAVRAGQGAGGHDHGQPRDRSSRARRRRRSSRSWASTSSPPARSTNPSRASRRSATKIPSLGIYKKLLLKDNRLHGVILVGDIEDEHTLHGLAAQRNGSGAASPPDLCSRRATPIRASKSPTCRTAKRSAAATASARATSSRRFTSTASPRWPS